MADRILEVAYCGGIVTHNGYDAPHRDNLRTKNGGYITTSTTYNEIVNDTDADAFVYEYCDGDSGETCGIRVDGQQSNQTSVLFVLKSCCSPKMPCKYNSTANAKIISDNRYVWSKEMITNYNVRFTSGQTEIVGNTKIDLNKLLNADVVKITSVANNSNDQAKLRNDRYNIIRSYIEGVKSDIEFVSRTNNSASYCVVSADNLSQAISVYFNLGTTTPTEQLSKVLSGITSDTNRVRISAACQTYEARNNRPTEIKKYLGLEDSSVTISYVDSTSSTQAPYCIVSAKKRVLSDYKSFSSENANNPYRIGNYNTGAPYYSYENVSDVTFSFINYQDTHDIPSATTVGMFSGCTALTECNVPAQMRKISNSTFSGCTKLSSYTTNPDFIMEVDEDAFAHSGVKNAFIGVFTLVKEKAFRNCNNLETIVWHTTDSSGYPSQDASNWPRLNSYLVNEGRADSGYTIPKGAFSGCTTLKNTHFIESGHCINPNTIASNPIYENNIYIPKGFTIVGESAFEGCDNIIGVTFNGIKRVEKNAFKNCDNLERVNGMSTVQYIGADAFTKNGIVTLYGSLDSVLAIDDNAFLERTVSGERVLDLPNATYIGFSAFKNSIIYGPVKLTSNNEKTIVTYAFIDSFIDGNVIISGTGGTTIGENAFMTSTVNGEMNLRNVETASGSLSLQVASNLVINSGLMYPNSIDGSSISGNVEISNVEFTNSSSSYPIINGTTIYGNLKFSNVTSYREDCDGLDIYGDVEMTNINFGGSYFLEGSRISGHITINGSQTQLNNSEYMVNSCNGFSSCTVDVYIDTDGYGKSLFSSCDDLKEITLGTNVSACSPCFTGCKNFANSDGVGTVNIMYSGGTLSNLDSSFSTDASITFKVPNARLSDYRDNYGSYSNWTFTI